MNGIVGGFLAVCTTFLLSFSPVFTAGPPSDGTDTNGPTAQVQAGAEEPAPPAPGKKKAEKKAKEEAKKRKKEAGSKAEAGLAGILAGGAGGIRVETMCTNCNIATVTMSGQSGERVQVWKDGLPVMGGLGAIYLLSILPPEGIGRTEIIRGAGTVLSGSEAGAGAVDIHTRLPNKPSGFQSSADFGGLNWRSQNALGWGKRGRWGGEFAVTHARSDGSDPNDDGYFDIAAFHRTTVEGTGTVDFSDRSRIHLNGLHYEEDQRGGKGGYSGHDFYRENIDIRRSEMNLGWDYRFRDGSRLTAGARYSERDQDISDDSTLNEVQPYLTIDETIGMGSVRYERTLFNRHAIVAGLIYRHFEEKGTLPNERIFAPAGAIVDDFIRHRGAFAQVDFSLPHRIGLTVGARYDDYDWTTGDDTNINEAFVYQGKRARSRVSPRMRLAWKATQKLALSLSAGYAFAPPRPLVERVCCGITPLSNSVSEAEVSRNVLLDADWVPLHWFHIRASAFRSDFNDFLQKMAVMSIFPYHPVTVMFNYGDFAWNGGELLLENRFQCLSYGVTWTHLSTDSDGPIPAFLGGQEFLNLPGGQIPFHPEDTGSAFVRWKDQDMGLELGTEAQYTGAMSVQEIPEMGLVTQFQDTRSFWVFNFRFRKRIVRGLSVFGGVDNITDEYQDELGDPKNDYQWGPLRGRYVYGGLSYRM